MAENPNIQTDPGSPLRVGWYRSFRFKILLYIGLATLSIILITKWVEIYGIPFTNVNGEYENHRSEIFNQLNLVADLKKESLVEWLDERRNEIKFICENPSFKNLITQLPGNEFPMENSNRNLGLYFDLIIKELKNYSKIQIIEPEYNKLIFSSNPEEMEKELILSIDFSKKIYEGEFFIDIAKDPWDKEVDLIISYPLEKMETGSTKGNRTSLRLLIYISEEKFIGPLLHTGAGLGETGEALLVNYDVLILNSLKHPLKDGTIVQPLEYQIQAKPAVFAARGEEGIIVTEDYRGIRVLAAYRYIPVSIETGWGLVVKRDQSEVFYMLNSSIRYTFLVGLVGILAILILIFFISERLSDPLKQLSQIIRKVWEGDLSVRASVKNKGEIGLLAITFNSMIQRLEDWHHEMETEVHNRTKDLKLANKKLKQMIRELKRAEKTLKDKEEQLRQSHKMEAIGTLAGGIAHDFNNILGAIMGFTELTIDEIKEKTPARQNLEQVLTAANRAKEMIRQILDFSRKSQYEYRPIRLSSTIEESIRLIRSSLPTTISIKQEITAKESIVLANSTLINQITMNMGANAMYAMRESGGLLTISLTEIEISKEATETPLDLKPGEYIKLKISDTGSGMDKKTLERIFEPYFTTKPQGEGTGMGLSVIYGIIKSLKGDISVTSKVGEGTTFEIYLPILEGQEITTEKPSKEIPKGNKRIMIIDDEEELARLGQKMIEKQGHRVTAFTSSGDALESFRKDPQAYDILVTDMTMPQMTGVQLSAEIRKIRPDIPVILCTGYSPNINGENYRHFGINAFVMKPMNLKDITEAINKVSQSSRDN